MSDDIYLMAVPTPREQVRSYGSVLALEIKSPTVTKRNG